MKIGTFTTMKFVVPRACLVNQYRFEEGCELVIAWFNKGLYRK